MKRTAFYPGSFDPFTNGHLDILLQALGLADEVVIAIGVHSSKPGLFTYQERKALIEKVVPEGLRGRVSVQSFNNLTTDAAAAAGASMMIRGLRDGTDLDYEMQLAGMNGAMAENIQTVFLPASPDTRPITATLVRQVATMGGDASLFVPEAVAKALNSKLATKS
ncbi:MAG: pantetheine-phosphate adenylyltransferase [Rhizobiaceae bacterium]